jgi:hypothetical protein
LRAEASRELLTANQDATYRYTTIGKETLMNEQAVMQQASQKVEVAAQERVSHPGGLMVTLDKWLGAVGERVEVLPSLSGIVVMSYESGCQVWLRSGDAQTWVTRCGP